MNVVVAKLEFLSKEQSQIQLTQRNLADNLQLRTFASDKKELEASVADLNMQLGQYDRANVDAQYSRLKERHDKLIDERSNKYGQLKQLQESLKQEQSSLDNEFRDIDKLYLDQKYKVVTALLTVKDFDQYSKALEE